MTPPVALTTPTVFTLARKSASVFVTTTSVPPAARILNASDE